jgi:hypothetical protein
MTWMTQPWMTTMRSGIRMHVTKVRFLCLGISVGHLESFRLLSCNSSICCEVRVLIVLFVMLYV